jgi:hypothetical protein
VFLTLGWVAVLAGSALFAVRHPNPTARDQTTVEQARPTVDEAVARIAAAAAADGRAAVALSSFEHVGCSQAFPHVTVFRAGERYRRGVTVVVPPGGESDLLTRVADRLPPSYRTVVRTGEAPLLIADAGFWVLITAAKDDSGEVRFYADTGDCREAGRVDTSDPAVVVDEEPIREVLERLNLTVADRRTAAVSCPGGGTIGTVEVHAGAYPGALDAALGDLGGTTAVVAAPRLYAFRDGSTQVAVRAHADKVIITATGGC